VARRSQTVTRVSAASPLGFSTGSAPSRPRPRHAWPERRAALVGGVRRAGGAGVWSSVRQLVVSCGSVAGKLGISRSAWFRGSGGGGGSWVGHDTAACFAWRAVPSLGGTVTSLGAAVPAWLAPAFSAGHVAHEEFITGGGEEITARRGRPVRGRGGRGLRGWLFTGSAVLGRDSHAGINRGGRDVAGPDRSAINRGGRAAVSGRALGSSFRCQER
jgi:hypothetical protein